MVAHHSLWARHAVYVKYLLKCRSYIDTYTGHIEDVAEKLMMAKSFSQER